jgi:transcriptional regulator with XRE-family HTH domain
MDALVSAVRELRSELGLTQPEFAMRVGLSVRAVAYYEKDRKPSGEILGRFGNIATRHGRNDLAKLFYETLDEELRGKTTPSTPEENAWVQAILLLLRNRAAFPFAQRVSEDLVEALESLARSANARLSSADRAKIEETMIEMRYHAAPNAERKIEELARARSKETGEIFERAYAHIVHERPDLYDDYLEDRAAAAKGTSLELGMARGKRRKE